LENSKNSTLNLSNISWPIFIIRKHEWISEGKIKDNYGIRQLDDLSAEGNLGQRRLRILENKYPLKKALYNIKDLITTKSTERTFIDSKGKIFTLTKKKYYPLLYRKIVRKDLIEDVGTIFYLAGINNPFETRGELNPEVKYVGVLKIFKGYLLYEFSKEWKKNSRRLL